jgi:hypothetical protein
MNETKREERKKKQGKRKEKARGMKAEHGGELYLKSIRISVIRIRSQTSRRNLRPIGLGEARNATF